MKIEGQTIILDAGEQITIKSQEATQEQIEIPTQVGNYDVNLIILNETGSPIQSTGEIRLYVNDHIGINTYLPGAKVDAGPLYTFNVGENAFTVSATVNGDTMSATNFDNATVTEARFYDYKHWNNIDAGFNAAIEAADPRCDTILKKSGTYVIKITKI